MHHHQPSYGIPPAQHQHLKLKQQMEDESCSSSLVQLYPTLNNPLPSLNHHNVTTPITHQLFSHHHGHHQGFIPLLEDQKHHEGEEHEVPRYQVAGFEVNYKLGLNESSSSSGAETGAFVPVSNALQEMSQSWHVPEGSAVSTKEPFWRPLNVNNTKHGNENERPEIPEEVQVYCNKTPSTQRVEESYKDLENKYRLFGELEAIYGLAKMGELQPNQTASASALTRENSPENPDLSAPLLNTSPGEDLAIDNPENVGVEQRFDNAIRVESQSKRKRRTKGKLSYTTMFFEKLVKRVIDHQEMLYRKFLEVAERMDAKGKEQEKEWRCQQVAKYNREVTARAHEEALALAREAQIVSYIEKITGQSINLPPRQNNLSLQREFPRGEPGVKESTPPKIHGHGRWPKAEVEALIQVRSTIDQRLQEPCLKGSIWEEVSSLMSSMGYQRSATRCKEKWENINKYFKKAKESSTNRRSQQSKTCSYFNQLDEFYSNCHCSSNVTSGTLSHCSEVGRGSQGCTQLVEGIVVGQENEKNAEFLWISGVGLDGMNDEHDKDNDEAIGEDKQERLAYDDGDGCDGGSTSD